MTKTTPNYNFDVNAEEETLCFRRADVMLMPRRPGSEFYSSPAWMRHRNTDERHNKWQRWLMPVCDGYYKLKQCLFLWQLIHSRKICHENTCTVLFHLDSVLSYKLIYAWMLFISHRGFSRVNQIKPTPIYNCINTVCTALYVIWNVVWESAY